ncbi:5'-deoxyadenosine deaminase [Microbacterium sediminicola]|uniref:5'-deoxyadenosine deaminase n=1 Tax=Microbacterium sediminicola TaxID=415210 RepID=A0ABP4U8J6_9MICO
MSRHGLVIDNAVILTMDASRTVVRGWLAVDDGVITGFGEGPAPEAAERVDAAGGILHPGYISAHQHSMDALARGERGEAQEFFDWLFGTYYGTVLSYRPEDAARAVELTAAELTRAGITTVLDCWGVGDVGQPRAIAALDATIRAADVSRLRWIIAPMVSDRVPPGWNSLFDAAPEGFRPEALTAPTGVALDFARDALSRARGRVSVWASVELPEMATDALLAGLVDLGAPGFTTHVCASEPGAVDVSGERAIERLDRLGVLRQGSVAAHLTFTDGADRAALAASGCGGAHCATATMWGGGSRSSFGELVDAGIPMGLGLDNATLNTPADMVAEMRAAMLFDRSMGSGPVRAAAADLLAHATIEGARALGLDDAIGSLEVGKRADLVLVDTSGTHWLPHRDPATALVLQSRQDDIRRVWVEGEAVFAR